jgi:hypothetical protein
VEAGPVLVAAVVVAVVAGLISWRLSRSARRGRAPGLAAPAAEDPSIRLSTADQRFRLLSFQGGSVPADLGPVLEELRRNGIEIDEDTLRRKLADGVATLSDLDGASRDVDAVHARGTPGTAIVLHATDVPGGEEPAPNTVLVRVALELRIPHREPIREQRVAAIADDKRALLVEGAAVPVRYDPDDPRSLTLEWEIA